MGQTTVLFDRQLMDAPDLTIFNPGQLSSQGLVIDQALGRGTTSIFSYNNREWVLRHFRRGGWIGKFVDDLYLGRNPETSRSFLELRLLAKMFSAGLPVPRPVAAAFRRHGCCHRIDLVTERIPSAKPLAELLLEDALDQKTWHQVGVILRQFHHSGIYHADLNARNILIDQDSHVFLIDFDRGEIRAGQSWQEANLKRLLRSLHKFQKNREVFHFTMTDWQFLLQGYGDALV